jgi:acyl carrier protein
MMMGDDSGLPYRYETLHSWRDDLGRMIKVHNLQRSLVPQATIAVKVHRIVADILDVDDSAVHAYSRFREDLGADSLDIVNLIMAFSNEFDAEIRDADVLHIQTIGEAVEYLERHLVGEVE